VLILYRDSLKLNACNDVCNSSQLSLSSSVWVWFGFACARMHDRSKRMQVGLHTSASASSAQQHKAEFAGAHKWWQRQSHAHTLASTLHLGASCLQ
jgi:hypothetical protein